MSLPLVIIIILLLAVLAMQILLWLRAKSAQSASSSAEWQLLLQQQQQALQQTVQNSGMNTERQLQGQVERSALATRQELSGNFSQFQTGLGAQMSNLVTLQNAQLEQFAKQLSSMRDTMVLQAKAARDEQAANLSRFAESVNQTLHSTLQNLQESNNQRLLEVRQTLETRIRDLQNENSLRLEEMRKTVDEKLHATLEQRLGESFKLVSDRLDKVHQGLGEMQQLAIGVGDLKRVLTNVKSRGTWGEVQLAMLLEQVLTPEQYSANVETVPHSGARVEFAIKLPGKSETPVWLPIDAKFPKEQYERMMDAIDQADAEALATASRELERAIRNEAKTIAEKYLSPPHTTDFAILFLPTEGLYAEVMRRPGLADDLQRKLRISLAGPSTLMALLNSLQMGFRTLALEKRSSEVWQVLGAVKTEFDKFGEVLANTKTALERAAKNIDSAEVRTRVMKKKLRDVEAMPADAAQLLLGDEVGE